MAMRVSIEEELGNFRRSNCVAGLDASRSIPPLPSWCFEKRSHSCINESNSMSRRRRATSKGRQEHDSDADSESEIEVKKEAVRHEFQLKLSLTAFIFLVSHLPDFDGIRTHFRKLSALSFGESRAESFDISNSQDPRALKSLLARFELNTLSSAELWVKLDAFVDNEMLSSADRRQLFWESHSVEGKKWLAKQHACFYESATHECVEAVDGDQITDQQADFVLGRTLHMSYLSTVLSRGRAFRRILIGTCVVLGCACSATPLLGALAMPASLASLALVGLNLRKIYLLSGRISAYEEKLEAIKAPPSWARMKLDSSMLGRSRVFVDPGRLEALIGQFRQRKLSSAQLWLKLTTLVDKDVITRYERHQLFWDAHNQEEKERLVKQCAFFLPENEVWAAEGGEISRADNELTKWCKNSCELEIATQCVGFVSDFLGTYTTLSSLYAHMFKRSENPDHHSSRRGKKSTTSKKEWYRESQTSFWD